MSMSPLVFVIENLAPLRAAVGGRDEDLLKQILEGLALSKQQALYEDEDEDEEEDEFEFYDFENENEDPLDDEDDEFEGHQMREENVSGQFVDTDQNDALDEDSERVLDMAEALIAGALFLGKEPGEWGQIIQYAAIGLGIMESTYPINEEWKWTVWSDYRDEVVDSLPADARHLLTYLVDGRALVADALENQGAYFAWLDSAEIDFLHETLQNLSETRPELTESTFLGGFHNELIEWLDTCAGLNLLLVAS